MKRTPLFAAHQNLGGKLIEFGGWEMPVQYTSITDEHLAVRNAAGLFDISHMGEFFISGAGAAAFLNQSLTNDIHKLTVGQGQYTLMCNERGGVVDDLYAYRLENERFLLIVNASRIDDDFNWLKGRLSSFKSGAAPQLQNLSDSLSAVALQGPKVCEFIQQTFPGGATAGTSVADVTALQKNQIGRFDFRGEEVWVSRTGYTGEDGFEMVASAGLIESLWDRLLETGKPYGLKPAGLGARDTLRTEVCYPLYGHELDENTSPIEAGVGFFVSLDKGEFAGRPVIAAQKANGASRKLVAFKMSGKSAPPRPQYAIFGPVPSGKKLGEVTSGTQSPSLGIGIGMGFVPTEHAKAGNAIEIEIRGKRFPAVIAPKPLYRKAN